LKARKHEAIAIDHVTGFQIERGGEHGPGVDANVKLAALSTGVRLQPPFGSGMGIGAFSEIV
jgi:hypothetical protein